MCRAECGLKKKSCGCVNTVSLDLRDLLLQSISLVLQYPQFVAEFEKNEIARTELLRALLSTSTAQRIAPILITGTGSYSARFWVTVTNTSILLKFWKVGLMFWSVLSVDSGNS